MTYTWLSERGKINTFCFQGSIKLQELCKACIEEHTGHLSTRKVIQGRSKFTLELKAFVALGHSKGTQGA